MFDKVKENGSYYGMSIYSDAELLSILTGVPAENMENTEEVFNNPLSVKGVGEKTALKIHAIREVARRLYQKPNRDIKVIHGPEDVAHYAMPLYKGEQVEHFAVMLLNTKNHILGIRDISTGSLTASIVHPREVFRMAVVQGTAAVILLHNHPSGDPSPSREDIAVTERLVKAGRVMDIPVLDHIILGDNRFVSLKEKGHI